MINEKETAKREAEAAERLKFFCPGCEAEHDYVLLDGYAVGDRLLEDTMFEVRLLPGRRYEVKPSADAEAYLSNLNRERWLKAMIAFAPKADFGQCPEPDCKADVGMPFLEG